MSSNNRSRRWNKSKKNANRGNGSGNRNKSKPQGDGRPAKTARPARPSISLKPLVRESADCPICGESIKDITSALSLRDGAGPAHFDCVLKQIRERETLVPGETIIYLGKGDFGVVPEEEYQQGKLQILRKIPFEQLEDREEWRMNMRQDVDFQRAD
ncbi:MAG: hypothetical protein JXA95_16385 [Spirochaetales bacterium]|nr:hypothetical protein [Spirochaetales bacterium]